MHPLRARAGSGRPTRTTGGTSAPVVAGFTLCRALRATGGGPPWRARQTSTGYDVVLRPLPAGVGPADFEGLPQHPHLAVPTVVVADGRTYAVNRYAPHGGLDALLERRAALAPGEVTTVVLGVGRALAAMHALGRAHGSVGAAAVLLDAGLRPLLDASLCRPAAGNGSGSPGVRSEDVRALGALAVLLLGSEVEPRLRSCLSAATDPDPLLRPEAADLVRLFASAVPPEAIRLTAAGDRPVPAADRTRRPRWLGWPGWVGRPGGLGRPGKPGGYTPVLRGRHGRDRTTGRWRSVLLPSLAAVVLLALAVLAGAAWARVSADAAVVPPAHDRPAPVAIGVPASPRVADWPGVLDDLDAARAAAFANADVGALTFADAPGSPAMARDAAAVRVLAGRQLQARGFRITVMAVEPVSVRADAAVLRVTDRRGPYDLVDATGSVVASQPARAPAQWQVELVRVRGTWLVRNVR